MKKLWKHEWKYQVCFLFLIIIAVIASCNVSIEGADFLGYVQSDYSMSVEDVHLSLILELMTGEILNMMLTEMVWITMLGIVLKNGFIYWIENDLSGREFIQTLPVGKRERCRFHICMDGVSVVITTLVYGMYEYIQFQLVILNYPIELPWLLSSYIGMMITAISYMLMILGVIYLVECIFVSGFMKIAGLFVTICMGCYIVESIFKQFSSVPLVQKIYGFLTMNSAGGSYFMELQADGSYLMDSYSIWGHDYINPPVKIRGEWMDISELGYSDVNYRIELSEINRLYDFSTLHSYVFHAIGYILIGVLLIGIVYRLSDKQEASKDGFYFESGRYLFSGLIAVSFYVILGVTWKNGIWQQILNVAASVIVFVLLARLLNPESKKLKKVTE